MANENEIIRLCALNRIFSNNYVILNKLLEITKSAEIIFSLSEKDISNLLPNGKNIISKIVDPATIEWAKKEIENCRKIGGEILTRDDQRYPYRLREIADSPPILYYKGLCNLNCERSVAVVGTRKCSSYGAIECNQIVDELLTSNPKPLIISGLAYGIDICAHKSALKTQSANVAVMATGIDSIYPAQHLTYANEIIKCGAIISDFPLNTLPYKNNFIKRNRLIAALSDAVILIESPYKGGGINTVRFANEFDREIYALPGRVTDYNSQGCNSLIDREIARIFINTKEFKKRMGWEDVSISENNLFTNNFNKAQREIVELLQLNNNLLADEIASATSLGVGELSSALLELELDGIITKGVDNRFILTKK